MGGFRRLMSVVLTAVLLLTTGQGRTAEKTLEELDIVLLNELHFSLTIDWQVEGSDTFAKIGKKPYANVDEVLEVLDGLGGKKLPDGILIFDQDKRVREDQTLLFKVERFCRENHILLYVHVPTGYAPPKGKALYRIVYDGSKK